MSSKKKMKPSRPTGGGEGQRAKPAEGFRPFAGLKELKARVIQDEQSRAASPAAKPAHRTPPAPATADDEALALHRMMSGVTPLGSKSRRIPRSEERLPVSQLDERRAASDDSAEVERESVHAHLRALVEGGRFEVEDDGRRVEGRRPGVPSEILRKLRRGLLPIDARIDLHGLRAPEARDALERFLGEKRARGERCVLVVHGKGDHSPARLGILRGEMAAWLSQSSASVHVAAFSTAEPQDGGEGAVYVLLVR